MLIQYKKYFYPSIKTRCCTRTRNKLIAEAFYLTKDIEKYGSGYIRVREAIRAYNTMKFDYEESGDGYLVQHLFWTDQLITAIYNFNQYLMKLFIHQTKIGAALVTLSYTEQKTIQEIRAPTKERIYQLIVENNQITRIELVQHLFLTD